MSDHILDYINYDMIEKREDFRQSFWEWFDDLSPDQKKAFWNYRADMAKFYYYNAVYRKELENDIYSKNGESTFF